MSDRVSVSLSLGTLVGLRVGDSSHWRVSVEDQHGGTIAWRQADSFREAANRVVGDLRALTSEVQVTSISLVDSGLVR